MGRSKYWSMKGRSNGIVYDSGFEKKFLEICRQYGVKVVRSPSAVPYVGTDGKHRTYYPDFYLTDYNYTIEIKGAWAFRDNHGFVREKYFAAMAFFKGRYTLITEREINSQFLKNLFLDLYQEKHGRN